MEFTVEALVIDGGIMSALMIVAMVLRSKIPFFQNFYVPVSLLAGLLGIAFGKFGLDILPFSSQASSYSGYLFVLLFGSLFIGREGKEKRNFKEQMKKSGDTVCLNIGAFTGLYGTAALVGTTVLIWAFKDISDCFGVLAATGFAGGHGSAAALGAAFQAGGWDDGMAVANTFATIGLLVGIFLGIGLIKYATIKGYTQLITEVSQLPEDMRTGLINQENRNSLATETVHSISFDSLAWHFSLICMSAGAGILFNKYIAKVLIPDLFFPDYIFALVFGTIIFFSIEKIGFGDYVDKQTVNRIGATITDYLVGFGVAMINIEVVMKYWQPLLIMCLVVTGLNVFYVFVISRNLYNNYWFERSMYTFGMCTGVASIGVLLLRVVDPEYKTGALEDIGVGLIAMSPIELFVVAMTPVFFLQGFGLQWGAVMLGFSLIVLVICKLFFTVKKDKSGVK